MSSRAISPPIHSALEMFAAPAIMAAPFVLGFGLAATVVSVAIGVLLLGLSLQGDGRGSLPLAAHAGFDYALATAALAAGVTVGLATGDWAAGIFLVGVGAAQTVLTASTRFSAVRSA